MCVCGSTVSLSVGSAWAPFMMTSWTLSTDRSLPACSRRWLKKPITCRSRDDRSRPIIHQCISFSFSCSPAA